MNSNFVFFIIVFFLLHVYLCMDLWRIWLQHLQNHYKTALSTIRETFVYTAARIWERTTRRDFVCTRQISLWSSAYIGLPELVYIQWVCQTWQCGLFKLNWVSGFPIQKSMWMCYGKSLARCCIQEVDRCGPDSVSVCYCFASSIVEILLHFWYRDVIMFRNQQDPMAFHDDSRTLLWY